MVSGGVPFRTPTLALYRAVDLVYGGHAGWAAAEFNLIEAELIEMIQGHQPCLMREGDNGWMDLRWTLTDLGRRTCKARFKLIMKLTRFCGPPSRTRRRRHRTISRPLRTLMTTGLRSIDTCRSGSTNERSASARR
jgi:hypothetical protein